MKRVAIITSSDTGYRGEREDLSGPAIREIVEKLSVIHIWHACYSVEVSQRTS